MPGETRPEVEENQMKVVVVGGVAGGMSFAARARRLAENARIVVLERDPYVSFANCGLPYHLGGDIPMRESLILESPESLAASLNLDVRVNNEVIAIDRDAKTVTVRERETGREYTEDYDALVLSPGAGPVVPPIPGVDLPQVQVLRNVPDMDRLKKLVDSGARRAVVVGAGFVGLEVAEAFRHRDLDVSVIELADQVLTPLDPEMAVDVANELRLNDVDVRTGVSVTAVRARPEGSGSAVEVELSDGGSLDADVVLLAVGVRPDSRLARETGLRLNDRAAIVVDENLQTSDPSIYAVGDAIEVVDAVTGTPTMIPLAGPANRQGRAAADHLFGRSQRRAPVLGTAIVKVFDLVAATTGRGEKALRAAGVDFHAVHLHPVNHASYYPGAMTMHLKVLFSPDGRLLGAQAVGMEGVDKRIDVLATAIRAGMTVTDLADLELSYAPPFGSAKDPVNMAGFLGVNLLAGDLAVWHADDLDSLPEDAVLVDARSRYEHSRGHLPGALLIPHTELRDSLARIPRDRPVYVYCHSGVRSYYAMRVLRQNGWDRVFNLSGGLLTLERERPALELVTEEPVAVH
jgi:NADPH-dependent 2,4-dienoyl-CoA reductase/sulfur reductase-like enzyme/rhodanese-related sulfurtransferase